MGDYNPGANNPLGPETRYKAAEVVQLNSPLTAVMQRLKPGAITLANKHLFVTRVGGSPGLADNFVTDPFPAVTISYYRPGTDTGATTTGWQDFAGAALNFGDVNQEYDDSNGGRNTAAQSKTTQLPLKFRGNDAGALTGRRILRVRVGATFQLRRLAANAQSVLAAGGFTINAVDYYAQPRTITKTTLNAFSRVEDLATFYLNPETGLPWTAAEVDDIIDAADADTMNVYTQGKLEAAGWRLSGYWTEVMHCAENRVGFYYQQGAIRPGYNELPVGGASLLTADTYYYEMVSVLNGSAKDFIEVPLLTGDWVPAVLATETATEHRQASIVTMTTPSGVAGSAADVDTKTDKMVGGYLLERTGAVILGQSQPYAEVPTRTINASTPANTGTQITGAAGQNFAALLPEIGWETPGTIPAAPLVLEVRSGVGAITGGGTLHGTAIVKPGALPNGDVQKHQAALIASFLSAAVQYHVHYRSSAPVGAGWRTVKQDSRSDLIGTGTTVAEIEGATYGGQTDSYFEGGVALDRYDLGVAFLAAPAAPTGFTVEILPAAHPDGESEPSTIPVRARCRWTATALGASFGEARIDRRPLRTPQVAPTRIATFRARDGQTAAQCEANETVYTDYELGGTAEDGPNPDGWEYILTVVSSSGLVSPPVTATSGPVPCSDDTWGTNNEAWWLNTRLRVESEPSVDSDRGRTEDGPYAGRDFSRILGSGDLPATKLKLRWAKHDYPSLEEIRLARAAAMSFRRFALVRCTGDRVFGVLDPPTTDQRGGRMNISADFIVTALESNETGSNEPLGVNMDGVADCATMPDDGQLNPGTSPFTFAIAAKIPNTATVYASKGSLGVGQGFGFLGNGLGVFSWFIDGAGVPTVNISAPVPADFAVIIGDSDGTNQSLWINEVEVGTSTVAHGSITNSIALAIAANNGGANLFAALRPFRSTAFWRRILTPAEKVRLSRYWHGHHGYRPPVSPTRFVDLRNSACFEGNGATAADLTGSGAALTLVSSPPIQGRAASLIDVDRWT